MLSVGYDQGAAIPFVRSENSWGASWGELGFVRVGLDATGPGVCGVYQDATYITTSS